jgi:hypothetical protein
MSATLQFKPSASQDVASYKLYAKEDEPNVNLTKDNATIIADLGKPNAESDGFCRVVLNTVPELSSADGMYDLGVAAVDDAGNESPLLLQGLADISLDFLAPSPPSEASVYFS